MQASSDLGRESVAALTDELEADLDIVHSHKPSASATLQDFDNLAMSDRERRLQPTREGTRKSSIVLRWDAVS